MQKDCPKAPNPLFLYKYLPDGETCPSTYYQLLNIPALRCQSPAKEGQWMGRWSRCLGSQALQGTAPDARKDQSDHLSHVRSSPKYLVAVPIPAVETATAGLVSRVEGRGVIAAGEARGQVNILSWGTTHVSCWTFLGKSSSTPGLLTYSAGGHPSQDEGDNSSSSQLESGQTSWTGRKCPGGGIW